jgi:hypothetical protein
MISGWDDAPLADIARAGLPKPVTFVLPYFENPLFLAKQLYGWSRLPQELRAYLSAIIVDDCSPDNPAEKVIRASQAYKPFPIRLYRIDTKARWNWLAARNIGMSHAPDGWVAATDMDHVIPVETAEALVWGRHDESTIYRFSRVEHTGEAIHPHPNSWFMTRAMFWKFGGYDEALSGHYGTDGEARRRWVKTAPVRTLTDRLVRWERYGDASTTHYGRKEPVDLKAQQLIKARGKDWAPRVLSFPFHEVAL